MKWLPDGFEPHPTNALVTRAYFRAVEDDGVTAINEPKDGKPLRIIIEWDEFNADLLASALDKHSKALAIRQTIAAKVAASRTYLQSIQGGDAPVKPPPTAEETARAEQLAIVGALQKKRGILELTVKPNDPDLLAVQDELDALYKADPTLFGIPAKK